MPLDYPPRFAGARSNEVTGTGFLREQISRMSMPQILARPWASVSAR